MKRIIKYLVPLIASFVVLCLGVFLYFYCAPQNGKITNEIIKYNHSTQYLSTNFPFTFKTTCKITLNLFSDEDIDDNLTVVVTYKTSKGTTEVGDFTVMGLKKGTNLVKDKIYGSFEGTDRKQSVQEIVQLEGYFDSNPEERFIISAKQNSTFGRSASYLIFAGAGISLAVFGVLIAYELVSPVKNPERRVKYVEVTTVDENEEERKKAEIEIEKLKLENEKLKLQKEILEKNNKKVKCEHCGMETSSKNEVCPGCKAPLKTK